MKRSSSGSLAGIFPVKRQTSHGQSGGAKKAEHTRETRRGLGLPSYSGRGTSLDALLAGLDSGAASGQPEEVTSPPQRRPTSLAALPAPVKVEQPTVDLRPYPASPKANLAPDASLLSSPFAAWRHSSFQTAEDSGRDDGGDGEGEGEETFDLGTPYAAGVGPSRSGGAFQLGAVPFLRRVEAVATGAEARGRGTRSGAASAPSSELPTLPHHQQHRPDLWGPAITAEAVPENDENSISALISPVRPPPRRSAAAPAMLLTPEKEGGLLPLPTGSSPHAGGSPPAAAATSIQPMPSLSSWMVPAAKPPPQRAAPSKEAEAAVEEVLACLNFDPSQPRKMERAPSPLDRLLGDLGDSDFAPSVALWDEEHAQQQQGAGAVTAAAQ